MTATRVCFALVTAIFAQVEATTAVASGHISTDVTWSADTILVTDTVWVDSGVTLTVDPGTRVEFQGYYKLNVLGRILAQGLVSDSIVFTVLDTTVWRGIRFDGISAANDTSRFSYCRIEYTRAAGAGRDAWGGGIFVYGFSKVRIENCLFRRNSGESYGGGISMWSSSLVLKNNTFRENNSTAGGGICINGGLPVVAGNIVTNNSAGTGGGIYCLNTNLLLTDNVVTGNTATNGGGVTSAISGSVTLVNCLITNNSSNIGGGLFAQAPKMTLVNCTVANNAADMSSGGIYSSTTDPASSPVLWNVILWGNTANDLPNQLGLNNPTVHPEIRYCNIQGGLAGISGNGVPSVYTANLDLDPQFVDSANGDYTVLQTSPCVNTGTPDTAGLSLPGQDLAGNPRIHDGAVDRIDMGAYEYQGAPADYLIVTHPGSAASLDAGTLATIAWTSVGTVGDVRMEFSADSGSTWQEIGSSAPNTGTYDWSVPDQVSSACVVRVSEAADGFPLAESDGFFAIVPGEFKLVSPNDGTERWKAGSTHDIVWTSVSGTGNVKLEYSTDSGSTWNPIVASTANDNRYSWTVPNDPSFGCRVRISEAVSGYPFDESDSLFGIYDSTLLVTCGEVTGSTVWDTDTVRVVCPVIVDSGATLTINPGTRVEFQGRYGITVMGRLQAVGTVQDSIVFTAPDTTPNAAGGWTGIRFRDVAAQSDTSKIAYCRIEYVRTYGSGLDGYGGGVFVHSFNKVVVSNSTLRSNIAGNGGAGICTWLASPVITSCVISDNRCTDGTFSFGAGIFCLSSSPLISDNTIRNNRSSREGGGIACQGGAPRIVNNLILDNTAGNEGGGIRCSESSSAAVIGNVIRGNQAVDGGGVFSNLSPLSICNNTIVGNRGTNGGGLRTESASPSVKNTIIWNNGGGQIVFGYQGNAVVEYSAVQGGWTGTGNVDTYPMFTDSAAGDYSLQDGSPCVNTGTPDTAGLALPALDMAGNIRVYGGRVDMGAYESLIATRVVTGVPAKCSIAGAYTNPLSHGMRIRVGIAGSGKRVHTDLLIFDYAGRRARVLHSGDLAPGFHDFEWNGLDDTGKPLANGFYLIKLHARPLELHSPCLLMR